MNNLKKKNLDDEPIIVRLECGCVRITFEETIRSDFCPNHAKEKR